MRTRLFLALLLLMLSLGIERVEAANHYIREGATGTESGTDWTNAFTTCPSTTFRGDTYYIADGHYGVSCSFDDPESGTTITMIKKAIQTDHGTDTGWNSSYGDGQATFDAIGFGSSYWTLDGQTGGGPGRWRSGFGFQVNTTAAQDGVHVNGVTGITIRHLAVIGLWPAGSSGTPPAFISAFRFRNLVGSNGDFTLSHFYIDSISLLPFSAIPIATVPGSNFIAEYGYVGSYYGDAGHHSEIASIWDGIRGTVTFRYNIFGYAFLTGGIMWDNQLDHNARLDIYGNVFWKDPTLAGYSNCCNGIIGGWSGNRGQDFFNAHVYNNSFVNIPGAEILSTFPLRSGSNEARNNLFYNDNNPGGGKVWGTVTHNHFISTRPIGTDTSTATANPFVDYLNLNFGLTSATPAGMALPAPYNTDMFGKVRGADGTWDRGAIEFRMMNNPDPPAPTNLMRKLH